ncbi:cubilin-like protein, partial [Leptotrombidium deliense]
KFIGDGKEQLDPDTIRRTVNTVLTLKNDLNNLKENGVAAFHCLCKTGWQGLTCNDDVNECQLFNGTDIGCQNGAKCINVPGSYRCECNAEWKGIHCTDKHDDCDGASNNELCGHGTCVNVARRVSGQPNYRCACDQGWKTDGVNPACNVDVDECSLSKPPCSVNPPVDCFNFPGSFSCGNCPFGFTGNGIACTDINECLIDNGGCSQSPRVQCTNTYGSRICGPCPPAFIGDGVTCTFSGLCTQNNGGCNAHAKCVENGGDVSCECPDGYTGTGIGPNGCNVVSNSICSSNPCIFGTCIGNAMKTGFTCRCFKGWSGDLCTVRVNDCSSNPCKNGGTCINETNFAGFTCICDVQWQGSTCEEFRESCGAYFEEPLGYIKYPLTNTVWNQREINCVWVIKTIIGKVIELNFTNFHISTSEHCSDDFLQINDGENRDAPKIGRFCGGLSQLKNSGIFKTTYNHVYIWYNSKRFDVEDNFELSWNTTNPECGDILEGNYGTIQYPPNGGLYPPNRDCYWLVNVKLSQRIQFHFSSVKLENHKTCDFDFLDFYDGSLWHLLASYCNSTQPSPLTSTTSTVIIHFHSDNISSDLGFHLTYSAVPGVDGCGGTLTAEKGTFNSPNTESFNNEITCEWLIQIHVEDKIILHFSQFELEHDAKCEFESVSIYDGNNEAADLIGEYCGTEEKLTIISTKNTLFVKYRTDNVRSHKGFVASYETYCGGVYTSNNGWFQSPYYPDPYPANKKCVYHIQVEPGNIIHLSFTDFDVEDSWFGCENDFVEIREGHQENGTLIGKLCGRSRPQMITSTVNELWIIFVTDSTIHNRGFSANYSTVNVGCGGVMKNNTGVITPPYHWQMPYNASCNWLVVAPPGFVIRLNFEVFSITSHGGNCNFESVEVKEFDGTSIGKYCGLLNLHAIRSKSNVLIVSYKRTVFAPSEGFVISYTTENISSNCGGLITAEIGYIRSPNFPAVSPQNSNCSWIIRAESGHQITLNVKTFDLNNDNCSTEYLEIRNGQFSNSPLIGKFCGTKIQKFILSHSNVILLHFVSSSLIHG